MASWISFYGSLRALQGAQTSEEPEVHAAPILRLVVKSERDGWRKHCKWRVAVDFEGGFCNDLQKAPFAFFKSHWVGGPICVLYSSIGSKDAQEWFLALLWFLWYQRSRAVLLVSTVSTLWSSPWLTFIGELFYILCEDMSLSWLTWLRHLLIDSIRSWMANS